MEAELTKIWFKHSTFAYQNKCYMSYSEFEKAIEEYELLKAVKTKSKNLKQTHVSSNEGFPKLKITKKPEVQVCQHVWEVVDSYGQMDCRKCGKKLG